MPDTSAEVSEAMWELERQFGLGLSVPDQVSIANELGRVGAGTLTAATVGEAFRSRGLKAPSRRYADALIARVGTLAPRSSLLGITNIAGNAPNHDGGKHDEMFASESKSGAAFSERYWRWLTDIPTLAGQIPVLVVADAPGPGIPTRRMVIVRAEDWRDLHGGNA